jgi:hypothetical protein
MREQFDSELKRIEKISKYNKDRSIGMLDDMATAYISSNEYGHLDTSLVVVRSTKKLLRSQGFSRDEVNDYMLENSYLSKTQIRKLRLQSLDDVQYSKEIIDNRPLLHSERTTTDLIIDGLKSRPALLNALKRGVVKQNLTQNYNVANAQLLINFYEKHKSIID